MATVKVNEKTYKRLNKLAGELRARFGRPVSLDEALDYLAKEGKPKPGDFAGAWSMTDEEEAEIFEELREFWGRWKHQRE